MRRKYVVMGAVALGLVLASAGEAIAAATGTPLLSEGISLDLGRRDYINYCAACHGVGGKGDGSMGEFLTLAVPDLTTLSKLDAGKFPEERIVDMIDGRADVKVHGGRDMPVWGDWFNREAASSDTDRQAREIIVNDRIASLVTFLKSIQEK